VSHTAEAPPGPAEDAPLWQRAGAALLAAFALYVTLGFLLERRLVVHFAFRALGATIWVVAASCLLVAVAPRKWLREVQTLAVMAVFGGLWWATMAIISRSRALATPPLHPALVTLMPIVLATLMWRLPLHDPRWRRNVILVAALGFLPCFFLQWQTQAYYLIQFTYGCAVLGRRPSRTWQDCARSSYAFIPAGYDPAVMVRTERRPQVILSGLAWLGLALAAHAGAVFVRARFGLAAPVAALLAGSPVFVLHALATWIHWLAWMLVPVFFTGAGLARLLGFPLASPIDNPWFATNFLEYWKRGNTYRYQYVRETFLRETLAPIRNRSMPLAIVIVIAIAGFQHPPTRTDGWHWIMLRWLLEAALTAGTWIWLQRRAERRVGAYVRGEGARPPRPRWLALVLTVVSIVVVLSLKGLGQDISYLHNPG
jgi:hypothetical protein